MYFQGGFQISQAKEIWTRLPDQNGSRPRPSWISRSPPVGCQVVCHQQWTLNILNPEPLHIHEPTMYNIYIYNFIYKDIYIYIRICITLQGMEPWQKILE